MINRWVKRSMWFLLLLVLLVIPGLFLGAPAGSGAQDDAAPAHSHAVGYVIVAVVGGAGVLQLVVMQRRWWRTRG